MTRVALDLAFLDTSLLQLATALKEAPMNLFWKAVLSYLESHPQDIEKFIAVAVAALITWLQGLQPPAVDPYKPLTP